MVISNKTTATRMMRFIISGIIVTLSCLLLCILFRIQNFKVYVMIGFVLIALISRVITMKYFKLEISEDLISIKYDHPLVKRYKSANLRLPLYKVHFCKLDKRMLSYYICIDILVKKKNKVYYYKLGALSESTADTITRLFDVYINNMKN